jgi:hypothetical protein
MPCRRLLPASPGPAHLVFGVVSITLDAWTSISQASPLAITGHYATGISSQPTVLRALLLTFKPMRGSHAADALSDTILECLKERGINDHIRAITAHL